MSEAVPYAVTPRYDTGLYNSKMVIWLFIASEIMLFGSLFSAYILLRTGSRQWPLHEADIMNVPIGAGNALILISSSVSMVMAWASLKLKRLQQFKFYMTLTVLAGWIFLVLKTIEYIGHIRHHEFPSTSIFLALYYLMTGVHAIHISAGVAVNSYFLGPGSRLWRTDPDRFTNRIEIAGLYWHFVDIVWIFILATVYLL